VRLCREETAGRGPVISAPVVDGRDHEDVLANLQDRVNQEKQDRVLRGRRPPLGYRERRVRVDREIEANDLPIEIGSVPVDVDPERRRVVRDRGERQLGLWVCGNGFGGRLDGVRAPDQLPGAKDEQDCRKQKYGTPHRPVTPSPAKLALEGGLARSTGGNDGSRPS